MSHKAQKTLKQFFSHPVPMNLNWRDVKHMFEHLGAQTEVIHGGRMKIKLNEHEHTFHIPHHNTIENKDEVIAIKHFLEQANIEKPSH